MNYRSVAAIFIVLSITVWGLAACGSASSGGSDGSSSSDGTSSGSARSCETKSGHGSYVNRNCGDCHNASMKPLSYGGSAPMGTVVTIVEDTTHAQYQLQVNSQGNFCLRTKNGGDPSGGYTAIASVAMVSHPTYGFCALSGCHDSNRPIY